MAKTKIALLYERLSRDDELQGESFSIQNQKIMLEDFARRNGFPRFALPVRLDFPLAIFPDPGYTTTEIPNRLRGGIFHDLSYSGRRRRSRRAGAGPSGAKPAPLEAAEGHPFHGGQRRERRRHRDHPGSDGAALRRRGGRSDPGEPHLRQAPACSPAGGGPLPAAPRQLHGTGPRKGLGGL